MTIVKYLDPKNDIAFKKIFGTDKNKDVLIHFLNDVLSAAKKHPIQSVTFLNTIQNPEIASQKTSIVDVLCKDDRDVQYIVEMQVAPTGGFEKRAQYYASKAYCSQMNVGGEYSGLKEVIFLAIADFVMFPQKEKYKCEHDLRDRETNERDLKDFSFTFLELPKFKKNIDQLESYEDKWLYFFKHAGETENVEKLIRESGEVIKKAYTQLETYNWTEQELRDYEAAEKKRLDAKAREEYVMGEGIAEGIVKGKVEVAKKLFAMKLSIAAIAEATGLSNEEILALQ